MGRYSKTCNREKTVKKQKEYNNPPRLAEWLLKHIYPDRGYYTSLGDFGEAYNSKRNKSGLFPAWLWYWWQMIKSVPSYIRNNIYWRAIMMKNYLKVAVRNIWKYKAFSFINITGLAVGFACCIIIALWIKFELGYDSFHKDSVNIYQVLAHGSQKNNPSTPAPLAKTIRDEFPEVLNTTRFDGLFEVLIKNGKMNYYENNIYAADPAFFKIFNFPLLKGDMDKVLNNVNSIVISESIARKYFLDEESVGKVLTMDNKRDLTVTGVFRDVPDNSTLRFDMIVPFEIKVIKMREFGWELNWDSFAPSTFFKIQEGASPGNLNENIAGLIKKHVEGEDVVLSILHFKDRNLFFSNKEKLIYSYSAIALVILIIACINFMNLSTARSANRAKEIGVRKVTGAHRKNIIVQFLGESVILSCTALLLGLIMVYLLLPGFNIITGNSIKMDLYFVLPVLILLACFTGLAAGSYPALFLSAFQPVKVLKGNFKTGAKSSTLRKILVVFQFSLSIFFITGTGVIFDQINYIKNKNIGYNKNNIIRISLKGESRKYYDILKNRLLSDKRIINVTGAMAGMPYFGWTSGTADWDGKDPQKEYLTSFNYVDYDFIETLKIKMLVGRSFSRDFPSDVGTNFLVNEEMVKLMGIESGVGARLTYFNKTGRIIGIMKNYHFQPLNRKIKSQVLILDPGKSGFMLIRTNGEDINSTIGFIKETWKKTIPFFPLEHRFLNDVFGGRYTSIERTAGLSKVFAVLAIFIACLGLFGLASFTAEQRSREIGVRKILGASGSGIVLLLSREFTGCVLIANLFAWPAVFFLMNIWLNNFAYRTEIRLDNFIYSAVISFIISSATISIQALKAARANPVDTLKYE